MQATRFTGGLDFVIIGIKGFEETSFPQDYFDIVVGNVPFGGYGVYDSEYSRQKFMIHDYFIAKSIDRVKPNGIVAVVTSKGTLDKLNPVARKYMAERAELLGALRLPNNAFKQTANTEAVTGILFFQKREERINDTSDIEWLGTGKTEDGFEVIQKMRGTKRAYTKFNEVNIFSGLLFCADCGGKMTIRRRKEDRRKDAFICSTYRKKKKNLCTEHAVKVNALEQIVLSDIRKVCAYVRQYEEEFVEDFRQCSVKESARQQAAARNELTKAESRLSEIEKIIVKLYEEKVCGRMSEDRFELLAKNYETEQAELKDKAVKLRTSLETAEETANSIAKFITLVRSYTEVAELTPEILNSFIDKIYIGKPERIDGQRVQEVKIVYKLVGAVNIPQ